MIYNGKLHELIVLFEEFWWLGIVSLACFLATLVILPFVIIRLPSDYFLKEKADGFINRQTPSVKMLLLILKNLTGFLLLLLGFIMLFVPGQGVLTILAGLSIMNFPGKRKLELRLASSKKVMAGLNWIRKKGKRERFLDPAEKGKEE